MHVGDDVTVSVDAVPGVRFAARVESFSSASGAKFALLPPDNATGNFTRIVQRIPVEITFLPRQTALDNLRPGMSAVVKLKWAGHEFGLRGTMMQAKRDNASVIAQ